MSKKETAVKVIDAFVKVWGWWKNRNAAKTKPKPRANND